MKTASKSHNGISQSAKITAAVLAGRMLQACAALQKYAYWLLSVFIFFSCQKNLIQTTSSPVINNPVVEAPVESFISIDTSEHYVLNHRPSCLSDSRICKRIHDKVAEFYHGNLLETKWMTSHSPTPLFYQFLDKLKDAEYFGLDPESYRPDYIEELVNTLYKNQPINPRDIIDADITITEAFFLFSIHIKEGRVAHPGYGDKIWITPEYTADSADVCMLISMKSTHDLDETIKNLQPANDQYENLQKMLIVYRKLAMSETDRSFASVRAGVKAGSKNDAVPRIRKRLELMNISTGDIASLSDSLDYDSALQAAIKIFQQRHGLEADGIVGDKTITWLNLSFKERADLIALNMERMRWAPAFSGTQCIRVNIPEYKLRIYQQGNQTLEMSVIVGTAGNATPIFTTTLESIVFSPTWTVPSRIIKEEFVPRLIKDKMYYADRKNFTFYKKGVEIDPSSERWDSAFNVKNYKIVQKSGPGNALGLVKFAISNNMNIYLHDTPDHRPFSRSYRALSHGCIRLENPAKLADYLLQGDVRWDLARIKKAMRNGQPQTTNVKKQYDVHLEYNTVWVDDSGNLNFREDIYGHDERQLKSLYPVSLRSSLVAHADH